MTAKEAGEPRESTSHEAIALLAEKYGVGEDDAQIGGALAEAMQTGFAHYSPSDKITKLRAAHEAKRLFGEAAIGSDVPTDAHGVPLPRYRYIASDILGAIIPTDHPLAPHFASFTNATVIPKFNQTKRVLDVLIPLLQANDFPYNQDRFMLPEDPYNMPKMPFADDREKANFFLTSCLWMRRTDSNKAMRDLGKLFDATRDSGIDLFDPAVAAQIPEDTLRQIIRPYSQLRMLDSNIPGMINNMRFLNARFDGDIRNAFAGGPDFDEVMLRLKNSPHQADPSAYLPDAEFANGMYGFAHKMVSMLTYYLTETGLVTPFDYPPPIDQHLAKLSKGTDCITITDESAGENYLTEELQRVARDLYYDMSLTHGMSVNDIAKALWLLGSKNCSLSPVTFSKVVRRDGRNSILEEYEPNYAVTGFDTASWYATCGACPLDALCTSVTRGKANHLLGRLASTSRDEMPKPGDFSLFGDDPKAELATAKSAAAARDERDKTRRLQARPAYENSKTSQPPEPIGIEVLF